MSTFSIQYSHCTNAQPQRPDVAPFTRYELRTADGLKMYRVAPIAEIRDDVETFEVVRDGVVIGDGETKAEAINDARWFLMNESRDAAGFNFNPKTDWELVNA